MRRTIVTLAGMLLITAAFFTGGAGCGNSNEVKHSDYGYCAKTGRHMHNDHVFIGDYHDHSLCEWEKFR